MIYYYDLKILVMSKYFNSIHLNQQWVIKVLTRKHSGYPLRNID